MIHPPGRAPLRVLVTGGGTGGHTYPALTTIRALQHRLAAQSRELQVLWVGVAHGLEAGVAREEQIPFRAVTAGKLRRSPNRRELAANAADVFRVPAGIGQALAAVARFRPDVVFSTGGYVSVPVGVAAWLLRYRYVMHEQTLIVGLANRLLARLADRILLSDASSTVHLPSGSVRRAAVTGNPIRPQLLEGKPDRARSQHGLDDLPLVLVTGGAQGAAQINQLVAATLPDLLPRCQIVHQTGQHGITAALETAAALPPGLRARYRPAAYLGEELPDVLAAADLVVARSGAGTVAELTALGKPMILIPLIPTGGDEQRRTARHLAEHDAAWMLAGPDAAPARLAEAVLTLLTDAERRAAMGINAARLGHPDAADRVVDELLAVADRPSPPRRGSGGRTWPGRR